MSRWHWIKITSCLRTIPHPSSHLRRWVKDPNKRKHWSLKWAMKNLSQVASIMVLYHDLNDSKWIWSGKAKGRGLLSRHEQHMRAASSPRVTSNFYYMYPSKTKDSGLKSSRQRGYFEHLRQYVALAFDPKNEAVRTIGTGLWLMSLSPGLCVAKSRVWECIGNMVVCT